MTITIPLFWVGFLVGFCLGLAVIIVMALLLKGRGKPASSTG